MDSKQQGHAVNNSSAVSKHQPKTSAPKYPAQCRTFGELLAFPQLESIGNCAFCKELRRVWKYSARHYACVDCLDARRDTVLPSVKRQDKFNARLAAIRGAR